MYIAIIILSIALIVISILYYKQRNELIKLDWEIMRLKVNKASTEPRVESFIRDRNNWFVWELNVLLQRKNIHLKSTDIEEWYKIMVLNEIKYIDKTVYQLWPTRMDNEYQGTYNLITN